MQKSFYCAFGTHLSAEEVTEVLTRNFDMEFVPHESSHLGQYLRYSGLYADSLTIENNNIDDLSQDKKEQFGEYPVLIRFSNTTGKNSDKLSKTKYLKTQLSKVSSIVLLEEKVIEESTSRHRCTNPPSSSRIEMQVTADMSATAKSKCRTTTWKDYNAALKALGSLLIRLDKEMRRHGSANGKCARSPTIARRQFNSA